MQRHFTKMHGLGNDFAVFNDLDGQLRLQPEQIRRLADRHLGIGFDQLLLVSAAGSDDVEFTYRIYNADGSEVEHCGNGARCFARYVIDKGLTESRRIPVMTKGGRIVLVANDDGTVTVEMGVPEFAPHKIPFSAESQSSAYTLELKDRVIRIGAMSIGNPHAVTLVDDTDTAEVDLLGAQIESHKRFPRRVNAGFMQVVSRNAIRLRVYERGVGETRACGTGACAAAVIGMQQGLLDDTVSVSLPGGDLSIHWPGEGEPVFMTGPATTVFEGTITL
ncbi:diaminopimelate epimerase [Granulosicoccaceae sp. 1_MG-2023]|nr:diaminopimelate epimerase [Granulosicoccaceae sp. 1_MG-2023]